MTAAERASEVTSEATSVIWTQGTDAAPVALNFGDSKIARIPREAARSVAALLRSRANTQQRVKAIFTIGAQEFIWEGTGEEALRLAARVEAAAEHGDSELRRLRGAAPRKRIDHVERDERGEIARVDSTFRY